MLNGIKPDDAIRAFERAGGAMNYTILVHPAQEGGYWTEVPALSGCFSQGDKVEEAIENTRDAIECYTAALREDGVEVTGDDGFLIAHVSIAA